MTYCTPYLLELGLTKSRVSLVWLAGPLSGLIMQPLVGALADRSRSPWGRRRPFMIGGTVIVIFSLILLGWTRQIMSVVVFDSAMEKDVTIAAAVLAIYGIDFAINAVQASSRSLIVDTLPASKQQMGSAWASRMVAVGHLLGYAIGSLDLAKVFGTVLGDSQFKQMVMVSAMMLLGSVGLTCWGVTEKPLLANGSSDDDGMGAIEMVTHILKTMRHLPPRIAVICWVQFWSWIGWFPFLFYTSTWLGEIWLRYNVRDDVREHPDTLGEIGRVGSLTLVAFSTVTFVSSVALPWLVRSPDSDESGYTPRPPVQLEKVARMFESRRPDLLGVWATSHLMFAVAMCMAPFITSLGMATVIVGVCGVPWALQCWAPFTFMGIEINRMSKLENEKDSFRDKNDPESTGIPSRSTVDAGENGPGELTGVYLGILNIFTTLPQFLGTFLSWIVFSILEPGKSPELDKQAGPDEQNSTDGPNAIAVCLFIGGLAAFGAAHMTRRLRRVD
ncbi:MFS general substrate transporter [Eremomyces bilateralis CBS 781.70]|uniref:MFS general substrate transporter n=1 Tax=Eremomyces bilateralis CBS 781.70 TaxID=1392243 RepID=A0A6G1G5N4_9PEZI|nr:MFS general substrate transporter [Eremomyces bilateralis CBS 781.70]KAF1813377.1 MFS general substrate transporter [Eremomyces bilateralis CBS 781.70]